MASKTIGNQEIASATAWVAEHFGAEAGATVQPRVEGALAKLKATAGSAEGHSVYLSQVTKEGVAFEVVLSPGRVTVEDPTGEHEPELIHG